MTLIEAARTPFGRIALAGLIVGLGWSVAAPCVCRTTAPAAAHACGSGDGLRAAPTCCCQDSDSVTAQFTTATWRDVARSSVFAHAFAPVVSRCPGKLPLGSPPRVAPARCGLDHAPPTLIALRI